MATSKRTHRKEGGLDMTALQEGIRLGRHQGREVQTIGDRVVVNPRFRLAALRDVDGNVIETVRLSLEVCGCGYSYARPGVGYAGAGRLVLQAMRAAPHVRQEGRRERPCGLSRPEARPLPGASVRQAHQGVPRLVNP